ATPPKKLKSAARKRKAQTRAKALENEPLTANEAPPLPRILAERQSRPFDTPQEMRREFDLIMAWLLRKGRSRRNQDILQLEVRNLGPQLGESLQQEAAEKRQTRIAQALTPKVSGEGRAAIEQAVRMVDGIKPLGDGSGNYYLMYGQ